MPPRQAAAHAEGEGKFWESIKSASGNSVGGCCTLFVGIVIVAVVFPLANWTLGPGWQDTTRPFMPEYVSNLLWHARPLPEDQLRYLMQHPTPRRFAGNYYINRSNVYPSLDEAFFQIWYGPKQVGKTTEAEMLVNRTSLSGKPVLYLAYKDGRTFTPFLNCFKTYVELPEDSLFSAKTVPYLQQALEEEYVSSKTAPLLVIDDINVASADDVYRWVTLGGLGKNKRSWKTVLVSSPGEGMQKLQRVSDLIRAEQVIFGAVSREEAYEYLGKVKSIENPVACWIWHVVGGKPGDLETIVPNANPGKEVTKADIVSLRNVKLRKVVETAYAEARASLGDVFKKTCFDAVLVELSDHSRGIRNGKVSPEKCLRNIDVERVVTRAGCDIDVLRSFLNAGNILTQDPRGCYLFETVYVENEMLERFLGEPYPDFERICDAEANNVPNGEHGTPIATRESMDIPPV
eukprot:gb/GECG01014489.1/.p1 GENE.gb/GECG01014489.1/~~gb/GECG01014489.1/.p1  ORF type:complete len:461 (+),score=44.15 gb/GECG01014489.1/:1-1383(+)